MSHKSQTSLAKNAPNFEIAVAELETIVSEMEAGNLSLEASLSAYQRGTLLLQHCQKSLSDIEQQVRILNDGNQAGNQLSVFTADND